MRNVVLTGCLAALLIVLGSGPAVAHASLQGSDPQDGSTLATAPAALSFTFNENIGSPAFVAVKAPDGSVVDVGTVRAVDNVVSTTVADPGQRGTYTASYRVVSADGHPIEGSIRFSVSTGESVTQVDPPAEQGFVHRHRSHLFWGILAAAVAVALLLAPLRGRHGADDT